VPKPIESAVSDHIDLNKPVPRIVGADLFDPNKPVPHLATLNMSWGVFDLGTLTVAQFDAEGGHSSAFKDIAISSPCAFLMFTACKGLRWMALGCSVAVRILIRTDFTMSRASIENYYPASGI
jgi:hypothetical protein